MNMVLREILYGDKYEVLFFLLTERIGLYYKNVDIKLREKRTGEPILYMYKRTTNINNLKQQISSK